ncbi:MAG TPA: hypothetical protein ACFYEK_01435 [Candidatus Wunengus sp. YC60]|uniref:hypothetical protein n=1 Tax=Candidatus Wunengus sp. YC60 TaxID=3367697 RepID=UPI00402A4E5B
MMDARDAAAQRAALAKAKQIEDFNKKYQAPSTKHVAVQQEMTKQYIDQLNQWKVNALKKTNGNQALANKMLESDPTFNKWNKNWQDTKNLHDTIVNHSAELEASEKDPNFVLSPETRKAKKDMMSGLAYQEQNPFDEKGHNTSLEFLRSNANYDLDKSSNIAIEKAIPDIEQLPPEYKQRGKNEVMTLLEKEYFKPERVEEIANNLYREKYYGTDISKDQVKKRVESLLGEKIKRHVEHYDKWFKPDAAASKPYEDNNVVSQSGENVVSRGKTVNSYTEHFVPTNANDQKKELKFAISKDMTTADGSKIADETGYVKGSVQGIGVKPYYKKEKRFLTDEEVKVLKDRGVYETTKDLEMKPAVIFNVSSPKTTSTDEEGNVTSGPGDQKTVYFDTEKLAGIFKEGHGKDYESMRKKTEAYAAEKNANRNKEGSGTHYTVKGKQYTQDAIDKAAKQSGMSRDEYLAAINQK